MNAIELFHKDGHSAGAFYCEKCKIIHRTKDQADECCIWICRECGADCRQYYLQCDACYTKERARREIDRFEKAEKLAEWNGPVYCEGLSFGNGFFSSVDDLMEDVEPEDLPKYVWACDLNHFAVARIDDLLDRIIDNAYEDFVSEDLDGIPELEKAIEAFNEANKDVVSWEPNYKRAVILQQEPRSL